MGEEVLTKAINKFCTTPRALGQGASEIVYGCDLRSMIPILNSHADEDNENKLYYNRGTRELRPSIIDDKVVIQHETSTGTPKSGQ